MMSLNSNFDIIKKKQVLLTQFIKYKHDIKNKNIIITKHIKSFKQYQILVPNSISKMNIKEIIVLALYIIWKFNPDNIYEFISYINIVNYNKKDFQKFYNDILEYKKIIKREVSQLEVINKEILLQLYQKDKIHWFTFYYLISKYNIKLDSTLLEKIIQKKIKFLSNMVSIFQLDKKEII